ncbi:hypothetical protein [Pseudorhizobium marinum]|uniref:hypothetical protein n=1 Tax=Pseudorhizobium marinum TaxID=1496690 RepID=UPI0012DE8DFD|nr:hypothetical protein [Pseudorhizobium marinum]
MLFDLVPTVSFVIVFIVIAGDPGPDTFYDRLAKFNGLIAGALAIFAAYITVRAMRRTDAEQERRHRREMRQLLRNDVARVERLIDITPLQLNRFLATIPNVELTNEFEPLWTPANSRTLAHAMFTAKKAAEFFTNSLISDCEHLFDATLTIIVGDCREWADQVLLVMPETGEIAALFNPTEKPEWANQFLMVCLSQFSDISRDFAVAVETWGRAILKDAEEIKEQHHE